MYPWEVKRDALFNVSVGCGTMAIVLVGCSQLMGLNATCATIAGIVLVGACVLPLTIRAYLQNKGRVWTEEERATYLRWARPRVKVYVAGLIIAGVILWGIYALPRDISWVAPFLGLALIFGISRWERAEERRYRQLLVSDAKERES